MRFFIWEWSRKIGYSSDYFLFIDCLIKSVCVDGQVIDQHRGSRISEYVEYFHVVSLLNKYSDNREKNTEKL